MATFRYRYSPSSQPRNAPPAPSALLNLFHPIFGNSVLDVKCVVDTGADVTVLPTVIVRTLRLLKENELLTSGFEDNSRFSDTFVVRLQLRDLDPFELEVISSDDISEAILGRDVLNRYHITFDGPNSVMIVTGQ